MMGSANDEILRKASWNSKNRQTKGYRMLLNECTVDTKPELDIRRFVVLICGRFFADVVSEVPDSPNRPIRPFHGVLMVSIGSKGLIELNTEK